MTGLLAGLAMMTASPQWLSPGVKEWAATNPAPCYLRTVVLDAVPAKAEATVAAAGWFELRVNRVKAGENVLEPVTCQPDRRISEVTHDIAPLLVPGTNEIEILVGNGWFGCAVPDGAWGFESAPWWKGVPPSVRASFRLGVETLVTDGNWQVYDSAITFSALRCGEFYDARRAGARTRLRAAEPLKYVPSAALAPEDAVPCREAERYDAVRTLAAPDGDTIYDFGHNLAGWCEIEVAGAPGAKVTIDYDECLSPSNTLKGHVTCFVKPPFHAQRDVYVLRGEGVETWHPRFVYHGFRYAKAHVDGAAELKAIRARFVHSDFRDAGRIVTSDPTFTKLQDAARRSYLSNFVGIPTDCPHREKNGWTGDVQLACETGLWNFHAQDGYVHFLRMLLDAQRPNGAVPCIVPCTESFGYGWGSGPAWDAALFEIPRQLYRFVGDDRPAREAYPAMKHYLEFLLEKCDGDGLLAYGLGDWCHRDGRTAVTNRLTDSAYLYHFCRELADWARHFGEPAYAASLDGRAEAVRDGFNRVFYAGDGVYARGEWTALAAPLYFKGLCVAGEEQLVADRLVAKVRAFGHQCDYGILGSKWIPRALADFGYADDAWQLFVHERGCGYRAWVASGEDTLWESWGGSASHNHIMFGDFSAWGFEYASGIVPLEPGFRRVALRPHFLAGVESFEATYETPYGEIFAGWKRDAAGRPTYVYRLPPGVTLEPDASRP